VKKVPLRSRAQFFENLAFRRKTPFIAFREDDLAIRRHDEDAAAAADDLAVDAEFSFDLSRQTGGSGEVVSNPAVVDSYVHVVVVSGQWSVASGQESKAFFPDH
jgi:hypothetical protein